LAEFFEWINPTVMKYQSINLINYYVEWARFQSTQSTQSTQSVQSPSIH
jgi:hypothetical protein